MNIISLPILKQMRESLQTALSEAIAVGMDPHFISEVRHLIATTEHNINDIEDKIKKGK